MCSFGLPQFLECSLLCAVLGLLIHRVASVQHHLVLKSEAVRMCCDSLLVCG